VDVTTGVRFHPVEVALSMLIKIGVIVLIGASPTAVVIFEVLLNATSMFNHSNVRIPTSLETIIRSLVVTPDMHRIHHSIHAPGDQQQFRIQPLMLGQTVGDVSGRAARRSDRDVPRPRAISRSGSSDPSRHSRHALPRQPWTLSLIGTGKVSEIRFVRS
jgi:hypothetical protein